MPSSKPTPTSDSVATIILRALAAAGFIAAGMNHFRITGLYQLAIPPSFPNPRLLVQISGLCEIAGGIGLLIPRLRQSAGWGLIALLVAVFPANIFMAVDPGRFAFLHIPKWILWTRLPLQGVLVWWVWCVSRPASRRVRSTPTGGLQ